MARSKKPSIETKKTETLESFYNSVPKEPERKKNRASWISVSTVLLLVGALAAAGYFGFNYYKLKQDPKKEAEKKDQLIVEQVALLMLLPEGEQPTIADVVDKEKLKDQKFFQKAENGDKVLVYPQAEQAILFRPSVNKIINVAPVYQKDDESGQPISVEQEQSSKTESTDQQSEQSSQPVKVALLNGSTTAGLATKTEETIKAAMNDIEVVNKANASKQSYSQTIITDLSGKHAAQAKQLAELLGGTVASFPSEEQIPSADIGIILAK